jgi:hypothetical protein
MSKPEPLTARELIEFLQSCNPDAPIRFAGWQCVHSLTICEMWEADRNPVITFEEIN